MISIETKQEVKQSVKPFPKLMISKKGGQLIYFENARIGVRLHDMHTSDGWCPAAFIDYNEEVTIKIKNDE